MSRHLYIVSKITAIITFAFVLLTSPALAAEESDASLFSGLGSWIRDRVTAHFEVVEAQNNIEFSDEALATVGRTALLAQHIPAVRYTPISPHYRVHITDITAYSSSPDETWGDPFITASGERVRDGIIAANFLPFGTQVKIPELFGDKTFVVKDRMNRRYPDRVDIWFPSKQSARQFGLHRVQIVIFEADRDRSLAAR